ncbi:MAG TPA: hypothetical protein VFN88_13425 [Caulobacteraceae bacterium]|jgi:hypothetical protein|nr:hypothetical protein [Caulobacteraceae bacterium]
MTSVSKFASLMALAGVTLCGCAVSSQHVSRTYGREVRADLAAQIADPDAKYSGDPAPASNGPRAALAQSRYEKGAVVEPASTSTSNVSVGGGGGR